VTQPPRILYCHCAYSDVIDAGRKAEVLARLSAAGLAFEATGDLCGMAARRDPALKRFAEGGAGTIIACYPRAVRALFHAAGAPLPEEGFEILNLREQDADQILRSLPPLRSPGGAAAKKAPEPPQPAPDDWVPWFPVIDAGRCRSCKQCLNFCLFGVFELTEDEKVFVARPANCKTNCPACARICPGVAIIFPKHPAAPINGAEPAADEPAAKVNVDVAELLRGDVYAVLRRRQRGSRPDKPCACSDGAPLAEQLGIPPEVLAGNPELKELLGRVQAPPPGAGDEREDEDS